MACNRDDGTYEKKNLSLSHISTSQSVNTSGEQEVQIDGVYPVKEGTFMYTDKDESTSFDKLDEDSYVQILMEEEDGFVFVDYYGDKAYIKLENIKKD